jgi:hypothetical protein
MKSLRSLPVDWKTTVNASLQRATGYELRKVRPQKGGGKRRREMVRARAKGDRLVKAPTFILCTLRSGSTLLRVLMNSHSQVHAPHELHLRYVDVKVTNKWGVTAMNELGLDERGLEYLLWDRILDRELTASGKRHIVNKTPNDVFIADRIKECWPDSRFIFLLRHPAAITQSRKNLRPNADDEQNVEMILRYGDALERARRTYPGHTVRYEDLTADPASATKEICAFLGIPWEPEMLEYGRHDHGRFRAGLGDWADKIKTGEIQEAPPPPAPEDIPPALRELSVAWGYLTPERAAALEAQPAGGA